MSKRTNKPRRQNKIPLRAAILQYLAQRGEPVSPTALYRAFGLRREQQRHELDERLQRMQSSGQILQDRRNRFALPGRMGMVRGRVIGHSEGYGFLRPEQGSGDLFIPAREMRKVLHGDRVLARVRGKDRRGRSEAHIVEVIERANQSVVGRFVVEQQAGFVIPDDARINQDVHIPADKQASAQPGQIVVATITQQPDTRLQPVGQVAEVLGDHLAPGMEIEIAIRKHNLPFEWPSAAADQARAITQEVDDAALANRLDLRGLPLVTIDGEDARDFDDAVYAERTPDGWRLLVAIADVSHYVTVGSALDHEAHRRGNSVYFPERVIPMLPEALSNGICSLNPLVDRLCFVCDTHLSREGEIQSYQFSEAVMRSHARLTYTEVVAILMDDDAEISGQHVQLAPVLQQLYRLYQLLHRRRTRRGAVDLDIPETKIIFDANKKIERIVPTERNDAHRLIEECMLAANRCAAELMEQHQAPAIYRIHERPNAEKVMELRQFLSGFSLKLGGGAEPESQHYAAVVNVAQGQPYAPIVHKALLLSMSQARYASNNDGHFALGYPSYTHFTSPIRRYSDLYVHRIIKAIIHGRHIDADEVDLIHLDEAAEHCSMTERRADDATRDVVQWLKAEYMLEHIGEVYWGSVTGVTDFGVFVELEDVFVDGLVHVTALGSDYFYYDPVHRSLTGERSGVRYQLGIRLKVRVVRVDLDEAKIDFELAQVPKGGKRRKRRR